MKSIKSITIAIVALLIMVIANHTDAHAETTNQVSNIRMYDDSVVKITKPNIEKYTSDADVQKQFNQHIRAFAREVFTGLTSKNDIIEVSYMVKAYKNDVFSAQATFRIKGNEKTPVVSENFNYGYNKKGYTKLIQLTEIMKSETNVDNYLIQYNKKHWNINAGLVYTNAHNFIILENGAVQFQYTNITTKSTKTVKKVYFSEVPRKYFTYKF